MNTLKRLLQIPFVRGIAGAVSGAAIALVIYGAYEAGTSTLAYLIPPGGTTTGETSGQVQVSDTSATSQQIARIGARAQEIAAQIRANEQMQNLAAPAPLSSSSAQSSSSVASSERSSVAAVIAAHSASSAKTVAMAKESLHSGAPSLPSSGPGMWIAAFASLLLAAVCTKKIRVALAHATQNAIH
ncbi:MAG TPA: hypothetical protein VHA78_02195 [Candidatus Peribacteraceae bacterium]|nr:hypothetical protein [Candidatus Peribacteraceae bacterium]